MFDVSKYSFLLRLLSVKSNTLILGFLLLNIALPLSASPAKLSHYFQESWTTRDGLPHNTINSITQSNDGYLWLATWEGAARFNGREFEVFGRGPLTGLPDSGVRSLTLDHNKNLLLTGARGGVSRYTAKGWQNWPSFNVLINAVAEDADGNFWLASEGQGLFRQRPDGTRQQFSITAGKTSDVVHSLLIDDNGRLWAGTPRGLVWLDTNAANPEINLVNALPSAAVFVLRPYAGGLLIGTERGLFRYNQGDIALLSTALADIAVSALLVQNDQIWIGSTDQGLLRYSELGVETLNIAGGLPNNRILSLYLDNENSIWAGTNGGLIRLRAAPFVTYTAENGLVGDYVRALLAHSDGSVWVGTSQGISRRTASGFATVSLSAASKGQSILSLAEGNDGGLWIGTYTDGLLRYANGKVTTQYDRTSGLLANEVRAILPEKNGGVWIGTSQGLSFINADGVLNYSSADGLPTPFVMTLYQHTDGRLFVGTGGGVAIRQPDGRMTTLDTTTLDNAEYAFGFAADPKANVLWITTDRGLVAYDLNTDRAQIIGRNAGLPFDKVFQAVIDQQQNLWLSSNRGILRLDRESINQFLSGTLPSVSYELFGEGDGMQSAQANGGSMQAATITASGSIIFATSKGISEVYPTDLKKLYINSLPVVIEHLKVDGALISLDQELQLGAGMHRLELQFAGLGYIMPKHIQYSTKLNGFDSSWVARGNNTIAEYTNLPSGHYQFSVRASYPQGAWSEQVASFNFIILPYFWQRPIFWFSAMLAALLLIAIVLRWRFTAQHKRERKLRIQVANKTLELQQQADNLQIIDRERSELLQHIRRQAQEFELQARLDALTGLANRRAFDEALARECARARRNKLPLCLVLLDVDHFKQVNDTFSHSIGDKVLQKVAVAIRRYCREDDTVARWGGEEFAVLLPNTTTQVAAEICERMRQAVAQLDFSEFSPNLHITISIGIARYADGMQHDKLLSHSDMALYQAKQGGRNKIVVAES